MFIKELHCVLGLETETEKQFITVSEKPASDSRGDWFLFYFKVGKMYKFSELPLSSVSQVALGSAFLPQNSSSQQELHAVFIEADLCTIVEPHS